MKVFVKVYGSGGMRWSKAVEAASVQAAIEALMTKPEKFATSEAKCWAADALGIVAAGATRADRDAAFAEARK